MAHTKDFAAVIRAKLAQDPVLAEAVENEYFRADIAMQVYQHRTEAGLTQKELAERIGTKQSVISRLESANYRGHSVQLLVKIACALGKRFRGEFYACSITHEVEKTESVHLNWQSLQWHPTIVSK